MLAYQHAYHAGNFADVHKHLTLFALTQHLLRKESPITYVDTHAGRGLYPLGAPETRKLQEYRQGVAPLWLARERLQRGSALLDAWLAALGEAQQSSSELSHYPGSPWWLARALRAQDHLQMFELHPGEHAELERQQLPGNASHTFGDGLAGLLKRLPVSTPRLCVLIDPSYERKSEYLEVADALLETARKARHAMVMVWYPLLPAARHQEMLDALRAAGLRKLWRSELVRHAPGASRHGMYGSGLLLLNPPWGLDAALGEALDTALPLLGESARHRGEWWVEE
ncbi:23S rRNA (adenine2030-N6)-methyltransferase [Franzmannia pantelleriensis]|uniref:Ribosomal RNA large subunit methyltransferase J n=1 Tax=Franzmannia pantelleriensis TaxID=48727 RepID=A0A1G9L8U8_9GAMM|nr:23S rRNA (adenine(2030)-N(6))-methyltransferase RlmJ [Halomonas pantelleriensis]SDL57985.1 23S rRNA (adenine2030-N6)-methyltransferase [Halomonas pantelleriensis]